MQHEPAVEAVYLGVRTPGITSKRDLLNLCEVEDSTSGEILRCTFAYVTDDDTVWFGQVLGIRKFDLTVDKITQNLQPIPDEVIYPVASPQVSICDPSDIQDHLHFIKRPKLLCLDDPEETKLLPALLLGEITILERLKVQYHPNLARYFGCISRRGRITGIVLERYEVILQYRFEDDPRRLNVQSCIKQIQEGIEHLHSLGLAHNDLNPMNIGFTRDDVPVIFDFGSCRPFGEALISAGTPGWVDESCVESAAQNDLVAIARLESWMTDTQRHVDNSVRETSIL